MNVTLTEVPEKLRARVERGDRVPGLREGKRMESQPRPEVDGRSGVVWGCQVGDLGPGALGGRVRIAHHPAVDRREMAGIVIRDGCQQRRSNRRRRVPSTSMALPDCILITGPHQALLVGEHDGLRAVP